MTLARSWLWVVLLMVPALPPATAQDEALRDRVQQLIERFDAPKREARDEAEAAIIKLGAKALPFLPEAGKAGNAEKNERLERIRAALKESQEPANLKGTRVTLAAEGMRLSEILKKMQSQTGNTISDLREQYGVDATNPSLDLDIQDQPFLKALDIVARKAGVSTEFFTGDGSIGLMPAGQDRPSPSGDEAEKYLVYEGAFRIEAKQVTTVRNLQSPNASASMRLDIAWEPQLRPMLLALKADELLIEDDQGKKISPQVEQESMSVVLRPENPVAEINLTMEAPARAAQKIAKLKFKADVTVPANVKTFRFPSLAKKKTEIKQGDVAVTLLGMETDESNWLVSVEVAYQGGGAAFESYQQGLFNNRVLLQKSDGSVVEQNGGFNQIASGDGKVAYEYIFVDVPGKPADYQLVYETPSKVLTIPLEFEIRDIPLP